MGRPSKLTAPMIKKLAQAVRLGATYDLASKYAGVDYTTFRNWMKKAEQPGCDPRSNPAKLRAAILQAEGDATRQWLAVIEKAASNGQWQAAAWKLERKYPEKYGRLLMETRHTGPEGGDQPVQVQVSHVAVDIAQLRTLSPEQMRALAYADPEVIDVPVPKVVVDNKG